MKFRIHFFSLKKPEINQILQFLHTSSLNYKFLQQLNQNISVTKHEVIIAGGIFPQQQFFKMAKGFIEGQNTAGVTCRASIYTVSPFVFLQVLYVFLGHLLTYLTKTFKKMFLKNHEFIKHSKLYPT